MISAKPCISLFIRRTLLRRFLPFYDRIAVSATPIIQKNATLTTIISKTTVYILLCIIKADRSAAPLPPPLFPLSDRWFHCTQSRQIAAPMTLTIPDAHARRPCCDRDTSPGPGPPSSGPPSLPAGGWHPRSPPRPPPPPLAAGLVRRERKQ